MSKIPRFAIGNRVRVLQVCGHTEIRRCYGTLKKRNSAEWWIDIPTVKSNTLDGFWSCMESSIENWFEVGDQVQWLDRPGTLDEFRGQIGVVTKFSSTDRLCFHVKSESVSTKIGHGPGKPAGWHVVYKSVTHYHGETQQPSTKQPTDEYIQIAEKLYDYKMGHIKLPPTEVLDLERKLAKLKRS